MDKQQKKSKIRFFLKICYVLVAFLLLAFAMLLRYASNWTLEEFGEIPFSQVVFHLMVPLEGTNSDVIEGFVTGALKYILPIFIPAVIIYIVLVYVQRYSEFKFNMKIRNKSFDISYTDNIICRIIRKGILVISLIILCLNVNYCIRALGIDEYISDISKSTKLYENEYVDASEVSIKAPDKKKNLIYIFLESMESSYADECFGGAMDSSLIPNLTRLALKNENFTSGCIINGANVTANTGWTIAGMVAQTSGIPLTIPIGSNSFEEYSVFLGGATSIGEILERDGYNQMLMFGSDAKFAGRDKYFTQHGNYRIWDRFSALEEGKMKSGEEVWWGFEDGKLFEWSKEKILELAEKDEPFNFTILTADTHAPDGLVIDTESHAFEYPFDIQYENVIYNSDINVYNFIRWIQEQDFYEDTVIILSGDHLSMSTTTDTMIKSDYDRKTYFTIINSDTIRANKEENREFTTLDIFPTTLAAMGYTIEGDRLGLGTNLYSERRTLIEEYGLEYLDDEICKYSKYYIQNILK